MDTATLVREQEKKGYSISDLVRMTGLDYWQVYHTLKGHSAAPDVVAKLRHVLGIPDTKGAN